MQGQFDPLVESRRAKLYHYSNFSCLRSIAPETLLENIIKPRFIYPNDEHSFPIEVTARGSTYAFVVRYADWESKFFKREIYRISAILFESSDFTGLSEAVRLFWLQLKGRGAHYCYCEIPSEDNIVLQALGVNGFRVVETRLHYYKADLQQFDAPRFPVRKATPNDVGVLREVSQQMRNEYDRTHSDVFWSLEEGDRYLAEFGGAVINGFADYVIVPNETPGAHDAFFAANYLRTDWELLQAKVSQFVLAAVSAEKCRGWYAKLLTETCHHLKEIGADFIITNTQSTNGAVIHTYEKYGFKLGKVQQILSFAEPK